MESTIHSVLLRSAEVTSGEQVQCCRFDVDTWLQASDFQPQLQCARGGFIAGSDQRCLPCCIHKLIDCLSLSLSPLGRQHQVQLSRLELFYLVGLGALQIYCSAVHGLLGLQSSFPFLPLLLTSVYCALGVVYSWICFYIETLSC